MDRSEYSLLGCHVYSSVPVHPTHHVPGKSRGVSTFFIQQLIGSLLVSRFIFFHHRVPDWPTDIDRPAASVLPHSSRTRRRIPTRDYTGLHQPPRPPRCARHPQRLPSCPPNLQRVCCVFNAYSPNLNHDVQADFASTHLHSNPRFKQAHLRRRCSAEAASFCVAQDFDHRPNKVRQPLICIGHARARPPSRRRVCSVRSFSVGSVLVCVCEKLVAQGLHSDARVPCVPDAPRPAT